VPTSFISADLPRGTDDLQYRVDLNHVLDTALNAAAYGQMLAELARGD
jgi:hypothetical protein